MQRSILLLGYMIEILKISEDNVTRDERGLRKITGYKKNVRMITDYEKNYTCLLNISRGLCKVTEYKKCLCIFYFI